MVPNYEMFEVQMTPANFQAIQFFVLQLDQIDNKLVRNENVKQNLMFDYIEHRINQCFPILSMQNDFGYFDWNQVK